jgi:uncharacterized GH25 family protein
VDSRYVHGLWLGGVHGEGQRLNQQVGEFGIDPTGQTTDHESPTIRYQSVTDGPNDCWQRYRMKFKAERDKTSVWLHAKQFESQIGLVWFDRLQVRPLGEEEGTDLLGASPQGDEGDDDYVGSVLTGGHGRYRIEGIAAGTYDLCAACAGKGSAQKQRITVKAGKVADVSFNLLGGGVIRGKVLENIVGEPIPDAMVTARVPVKSRETIAADTITETRSTRTGKSGQFYLHGLLPGVAYHVTVEAQGYIAPGMQTVVPDGPETVFALSPEGGIFGTVFEEGTEKPVEGAAVRVFHPVGVPLTSRSSRSGERLAVAVTDADGQFTVAGLKKGVYRLIAEKNGRKSSQTSGDAATVRLDSRVAQARITLFVPRGGGVRGRAVEVKTGKPIAGVDLIITMARSNLPQDRSLFEQIEGLLLWRFESSGLSGSSRTGETDTTDSSPIVDDDISPEVPEANLFQSRVCVRTDEKGKFEVDGMSTGIWRMALRTEDYAWAGGPPRFAVITPGGHAEVEARLVSRPSIEGFVLDQERTAVEGVRVWPRRQVAGDRSYTTLFEELGLGHSGKDARGEKPTSKSFWSYSAALRVRSDLRAENPWWGRRCRRWAENSSRDTGGEMGEPMGTADSGSSSCPRAVTTLISDPVPRNSTPDTARCGWKKGRRSPTLCW